jgi:hypothetical protein
MNNWCIYCFSRIFLLGILIFKGLTARRLYKSFGVKGLMREIFPHQRGACGIGFMLHTHAGCVIAVARQLLLRVSVESW